MLDLIFKILTFSFFFSTIDFV